MNTEEPIDLQTEEGVLRLRIEIAKELGYTVFDFNANPLGVRIKTPSSWMLLKPGQSRDWVIIREHMPLPSEMYHSEKAAWQATPDWTGDMEIAFTLPLEDEEFFAVHGPCSSAGRIDQPDEAFYAFVMYRWPDEDTLEEERGHKASTHAGNGAVALSAVWLKRKLGRFGYPLLIKTGE